MIDNTAGVVLAGGKSTRFGSNKALHHLDGHAMIQRVCNLLAPLFSETLLVTNTPETYEFVGWPMVRDIYPDSGPLAGIHAALTTIKSERAFITACDMPLLNPSFIRFLCSVMNGNDVVVPWLAKGPEPLYGVYRKSALPVIERQLAAKRRKITLIFENLLVKRISEQDLKDELSDLSTFHNINQPEDVETLHALNKSMR
jgi:molybdopterin-guanine dinucleotide biosynthesis protein A